MAKFTPRLTAPEKTNRYYYSKDNIYYAQGWGMPNCTCFALGRFMEITGKITDKIKGNAEDFFASAKAAGYKTGNTPKLGAIVCYKAGKVNDGSDGAGHVCVVEEIKPNGDIVTSNSAWNGDEFYLKTITKASGYQYATSRQFQGFIYCGIEFDTETNTSSSSTSSTTSTSLVIKAGTKFELKDVAIYTSGSGNSVGKRSGTYYAWEDAKTTSGRIRMTNSPSRVGVANQVSFFVEVKDLVTVTTTASTTVSSAPVKTLTDKSYPDYTFGKSYHVKKSFKDWLTSKGTYRVWKNAFNQWKKYKDKGYHIYDTNGKQLD